MRKAEERLKNQDTCLHLSYSQQEECSADILSSLSRGPCLPQEHLTPHRGMKLPYLNMLFLHPQQ